MPSATEPQPDRSLLRTLRRVRSVRSFRPDPVPDESLTEILEVARWTGSGSNRQPWTFVVVREPATLNAIAVASPNVRHVAGAAAVIVIVMDGDAPEIEKFPEIETFDEGRVTERILVAATALGLASAIGWIVPAGAAAVATLLGVPEGRRARTLVSLGYPTEEGARPKSAPGSARRPLAELVRFERFS